MHAQCVRSVYKHIYRCQCMYPKDADLGSGAASQLEKDMTNVTPGSCKTSIGE